MDIYKNILVFFFLTTLTLFYIEVDLSVWIFLIFAYLILILLHIKTVVGSKFPFGEFIAIVFFVENVLALTIIYLLKGSVLKIGSTYYSLVPLEQYVPFAFLSSQAILIGYNMIKLPDVLWRKFVGEFENLITKENLFLLLFLGTVGIFVDSFNISSLGYVTYILNSFLSCALIGLALHYKKISNIYVVSGVALNLFVAIKNGMFGSLIYFIAYYLLLSIINLKTKMKIKLLVIIPMVILSVWFLALLQHIKGDYREAVWRGNETAGTSSFYSATEKNFDFASITDIEFYLPLLFRLNQGYLTSAVMQKVPSKEPFAGGSTIISSIMDALVPRFINPNKEEAGGKMKIKRFTNLKLTKRTSMNIGLLGESYANFGKFGAIIFLLFYGIMLGLFEKTLLMYSIRKPIILVFFPIFFEILVGSGTDFLMVFNGIVKSFIFITVLLYFFDHRRRNSISSQPYLE